MQIKGVAGSRFLAAGVCFSLSFLFSPVSAAFAAGDGEHMPLTNKTAKDISSGRIRLEDGRVDHLLYGKEPLDPDADNDNDGLKNSQELFTYEKDGKVYYGYTTHPCLEDTDGDGITDDKDTNPLVWDISSRDMVLFMELVYREDSYVQKVLNHQEELTNLYSGRSEYKLMWQELSPFWKVKRFIHKDTGFDAAVFETKSDAPYLQDAAVQVLAVRGTQGITDVLDDALLGLGANIDQAGSMVEALRELNNEGATNVYATGHSLGGYLVQRGMIDADKEKYTWLKKGYTFNAPKIKGNLFNSQLNADAEIGNRLQREGKSIHYKVSNDSTIKAIGNFDGAIDVGTTERGHSSRSYFEKKINQIDGFTVGKRGNIDTTGYLQPNVMGQKYESVTDADVYRPLVKLSAEDIFENDKPNLLDNVENLEELPKEVKIVDLTQWKDIDLSTRGNYKGKIKLIYSDQSESEHEVSIIVRKKWSDLIEMPPADSYQILPEEIDRFGSINLLDNVQNLPAGAKVESVQTITPLYAGNYTGKIRIVFANGMARVVDVPIIVRPMKLEANPEEVYENESVDLKDNLIQQKILPITTVITDVTDYTKVNLAKAGTYMGRLQVTFLDGKSEYVDVQIIVRSKNEVTPGATITPIPSLSLLKILPEEVDHYGDIDLSDNVQNLPDGARVEVVTNVSSDKVGSFTGRVKVVYASGASHLVDIPVTVRLIFKVPDDAPIREDLPQWQPEPEPNPEPEPEPNPGVKPEPEPSPNPEPAPGVKPEPAPEPAPNPEPDPAPESGVPDVKPESKPEQGSKSEEASRPELSPGSGSTPEVTPTPEVAGMSTSALARSGASYIGMVCVGLLLSVVGACCVRGVTRFKRC